LSASDAELHGGLQIESKDGQSNIGYWIQSDDWIEWGVRIQQPAEFTVVADVATSGESHLVLRIGDRELKADIPNTGDYAKFQMIELGHVQIDQAGPSSVVVRPDKQAWSPVNIRSITLQPVR
jgi:hypothetical protein